MPETLTTYIDGKIQHHYSRVVPSDPSAAQLQDFTGVYRSDEIEMPYTIALRDGKLVVRSLKSNDSPLRPLSPDLFYGGGNRIRFTRDAQGKIIGALLNSDRIYNFRFERSQ